ncbi:RagB/SusD family nutrient uptake outer membrane protein [Chitinophaga sedimenti]|uniref:RagB/SusD family nutrient uptake outer membrane protein n=1 Tax=Chitinophaga sedimenti TaxID=2033606 RepID=UPI00249E0AB5|nr:RagB/SusD family nutrient uptake outer membrane protein [Chitinophaga sedimenti]
MNTEAVRERMKYEAVLLRAFFYAELVRWYGGVPIITKVLDRDSPELYSARASLEEIQKFIVDECDLAAANLPAKQTGIDFMRVTSGMAKAIKARLLLHLASPLFNSAAAGPASPWSWGSFDINRWKAAADAAKAVIDHKDENGAQVYSLVVRTEPANYFGTRVTYPGSMKAMGWFNVFITRVNTEYILGYARKGLTNELDKWQLPGAMQRTGDASYTLPTYNYAAAFETKDGYPVYQTDEYGNPLLDANGQFVVNPASGFNPQKPYENRDSRFYHSLWYNQAMFSGNVFNTWRAEDGSMGQEYLNGYAHTGLFLRKFTDPKNITINNSGTQGQTSHNFPVYRLVEMLLNYAEAMNEFLPDGADRSDVIRY